MNPAQKAELFRQGGKLAGDLVRIAISHPRKKSAKEQAEASAPAITEEKPEATLPTKTSGKACDICALDHFSTCAGLMQHARDFALREGIESQEVITRIARCREQLNSLEREDLTPANIVQLSPAEQKIAHNFLPKSSELRHALNDITSIDKLENVAANAQEISSSFQNEIFRFQLKREIPRPTPRESSQPITLEEAQKLAAQAAKQEVKRRWKKEVSDATK